MKGTAAVGLLLVGFLSSSTAFADGDCREAEAAPAPSGPRALDYSQLPLHFEPNQGQADPKVRFVARGAGYALLLTPRESVLALRAPKGNDESRPVEIVRIGLVGANPTPSMDGADPLSGRANYLVGSEPSQWKTDIPLYGRVRLPEVYPGIGLTYYGNQRQLEYDFDVAPGADPRRIRLRVEGAQSLRLDNEGNLRIRARHGELVQHAPVVYQVKDGVRQSVPGRFRLRGKREVQFDVPRYDRTATLVIDPVLQWSVYLGGDNDDIAKAVAAVERSPNFDTFVAGATLSTNFCFGPPRPVCSLQGNRPTTDAFVTKFNYAPPNLNVIFSTYIGGDGDDEAEGLALNLADEPHLAGHSTDAANFIGGATYGGGPRDAFVVKLGSTGSAWAYTRFIGGSGDDAAFDIVVSDQGDAYVVGQTTSTAGFPLVGGPFQGTFGGVADAFVTKLTTNGVIVYSTYYGGAQFDIANSIALRDVAGVQAAVYFVGETTSTNFPLKNEFQSTLRPPSDAFAVKLDDSGTGVSQAFSSYLGGNGTEGGFGVDIDPSSTFDFYVAGQTDSDDFPVTADAFQMTRAGMQDGFVTKIQGGAIPFVYSTYLGGAADDRIFGLAVDPLNHAYVTGQTSSADFPVFRPLAVGATRRGTDDAFVTKLVPQGCALLYSTFLGGPGSEVGTDIAVVGNSVSVVGQTTSTGSGFPTQLPPPLDPSVYTVFQGPPSDAFVTSITDTAAADVQVTKTDFPDPVATGQELTYTVTLRNLSPTVPAYSVRLTDTLPPGVNFVSVTPAAANCTVTLPTVTCDIPCLAPSPGPGDTIDIVIKVIPTSTGSKTNNAFITTPYGDPDSVPGPNNASVMTMVTVPVDLTVSKTAPPSVPVGGPVTYSITVTNNGTGTATGVKVTDVMPPGINYTGFGGGVTCTPPPASTVVCNLPGPISFPGSFSFSIFGQATAPGVQTNSVTTSGNEGDPTPLNNSDTADTLVTVPGGAVLYPTARSSGIAIATDPQNQNLLEWLNPGAGTEITIHRTTAAGVAPCPYETNSGNAGTRIIAATHNFTINVYDSFLDNLGGTGLTNDTTYCYTIFVDGGSPRFISGRPFDAVTGRVRWAFNMGTWAMTPPGNGVGMVHAVSNDHVLYAMTKGTTGGKWPGPVPQWEPFGLMTAPAQGRPTTYPLPVGAANMAVFLTSQDGKLYSIDADEGGSAALQPWSPFVLGTYALTHPSGLFSAFGGPPGVNLLFAGSRETPPAPSTLYGVKLVDGTQAWMQKEGNTIGPLHGQPVVDYPSARVYFTGRELDGTNNKTLWCVDAATGNVLFKKAYGPIDAAATIRGDRLYIATSNSPPTVMAIDKWTCDPVWTFTITPASEGPAKGFVYARAGATVGTTELFFATKDRIWKLTDDGTPAYVDNWPGGVLVNRPSTPIALGGDIYIYLGSGDGKLHRHDAITGALVNSYPLGDLTAPAGSPTFDIRGNFIYVGNDDGIVYAVERQP